MATVLITDDAAFMRIMLRDILEKNGYTVIGEATNGAEAIEKYKELKPDLVTLDITMHDVDGIEACAGIMKENPNAKCIMCSAMGQQAMVVSAIKAGAKDFIVKPFKPERVLEAIGKVMAA